MNIGRIKGTNAAVGAPVGWNNENLPPCATLAVRVDKEGEPGTPSYAQTLTSEWVPSPEDLAALNAGHPIHLKIYGHAHPVVSVFVGPEPV